MARILVLLVLLAAHLAQADSTGPAHFEIDDDASWVHIQVLRGGLLAGIGHNHVVSVGDLGGSIELAETVSDSSLHLAFPVRSLKVDQPQDRKAEGERFAKTISDRNIAATRENMLGDRLLQADTHPLVEIHSTAVLGSLPDLTIQTQTSVREQKADIVFPVYVNIFDDQLIATGSLRVSQKDLGLNRFKAALGALRVKDQIFIRYRIVAIRR
jgi:hypothetical protein